MILFLIKLYLYHSIRLCFWDIFFLLIYKSSFNLNRFYRQYSRWFVACFRKNQMTRQEMYVLKLFQLLRPSIDCSYSKRPNKVRPSRLVSQKSHQRDNKICLYLTGKFQLNHRADMRLNQTNFYFKMQQIIEIDFRLIIFSTSHSSSKVQISYSLLKDRPVKLLIDSDSLTTTTHS